MQFNPRALLSSARQSLNREPEAHGGSDEFEKHHALEKLRLLKEIQQAEHKLEKARETLAARDAAIALLKDRIATLKLKISDTRPIDPIKHNSIEGMDQFFEKVENREPYERFGAAVRELLHIHGVELNGKSVLDFGVGPAIALKVALEGSTPRAIRGYDFSAVALKHAAEEIPGADFGQCDIYIGDGETYDLVLCTEVLEHLERPDDALRTLVSQIAEGGCALISVPDGRIDRSRLHINFWSPESWKFFVERTCPDLNVTTGIFKVKEEGAHQNNFAILRRGMS